MSPLLRIVRTDLLGVLLVLSMALPRPARAEEENAWAFVEAWRTFRYDLDASIPGEHGEVLLIDRLEPSAPWLVRDGLRLSSNPLVIAKLAQTAATTGDTTAMPALRRALVGVSDDGARRVLERALLRLGDEELRSRLAQRLRKGASPERWEAAATLASAGKKAIPALRTAMADEDDLTKIAAASALASLGEKQANKLLAELLSSPNRYLQLEAAHALALAGDPRSLPVLHDRLGLPGGDRPRLARSLGRVGKAQDRERLLQVYRALARGRSEELRSQLLHAIGEITLRSELAELEPQITPAESSDLRDGLRHAWLEELGRAVAKGAKTRESIANAVRESSESTLLKETPVAHQRRLAQAKLLLSLLTTGKLPSTPVPALPSDSIAELRRAINSKSASAKARMERFGAAVALLERVGKQLGHERLAEPPDVRAVGLGAHRTVDGNLMTSWVAGEMAGPLRLELNRPGSVRRLHLIAGCVDSRESYGEHARARTVRLTLDGRRVVEGQLVDGTPYFQHLDLPSGDIAQISIEVVDSYPGSRRGAPACISEIRLER